MTNKEMKIFLKKEMEIERCQIVRVLYIFNSSKLLEVAEQIKSKPKSNSSDGGAQFGWTALSSGHRRWSVAVLSDS